MRLRGFVKIIKRINEPITPEPKWQADTREFLLAQIRKSKLWREAAPERNFGMARAFYIITRTRVILRPATVFVLIFGLVFSSSFLTVSAAKASLPGDVLYSVKITVEKTKLTLVFSEEKKAELEMAFANTRLREVEEIIDNNKQNKSENKDTAKQIKEAITYFNDGLNSAQKRLEKLGQGGESQKEAAHISKLINEQTTVLEGDLLAIKDSIVNNGPESANQSPGQKETSASQSQEGVKDSGLPTMQEAMATSTGEVLNKESGLAKRADKSFGESLQTIDEALDVVDEANTKSLVMIVDNAVGSSDQSTKQEALEKLQVKIQKIEKEIKKTKEQIKQITDATKGTGITARITVNKVGVASPVLPEGPNQKPEADGLAGPDKQVAVSTLGATTTAAIIVEKVGLIKEAVSDVKNQPEQAQKTIEEAKQIIVESSTEKLNEVLGKVQETKDIVEKTKKVIKDVKDSMENIIEEQGSATNPDASVLGQEIKAGQEQGLLIKSSTKDIFIKVDQ